MDVLQAIEIRSSIRSFKQEQISDEELNILIKAADRAPRNGSLHLTVLQNREIIAKISEDAKQAMLSEGGWVRSRASEKGYQPLYNAPTVFLITDYGINKYSLLTAGLTAQNIIMAATAIGLGSCFITSVSRAFDGKYCVENKKSINIPSEQEVICAVVVGYPAEVDEHQFKGAGKAIVNHIK